MPIPLRYLFGRVLLDVYRVEEWSSKLMMFKDGLTHARTLRSRECNWGFFDIEQISGETLSDTGEPERLVCLRGYLGKYHEMDVEVAVPDAHTTSFEPVQDAMIAKAPFFLHPDSGVIAYHPVSGQITPKIFRERFVILLRSGFGDLFVSVDLASIDEQRRLLDDLPRFSFIRRVALTLHPSNPNTRDIWKDIDDHLRQVQATKYVEQIEASGETARGGLRIANDPQTRAKIQMAEDGYGTAAVTGTIEGRSKTVSTESNPIAANVATDTHEPAAILEGLKATFRSIFDRFQG